MTKVSEMNRITSVAAADLIYISDENAGSYSDKAITYQNFVADLGKEFPDGTAAAPSITFLADTDTGFYRIGTNNIGIALGGLLKYNLGETSFIAPSLNNTPIGNSTPSTGAFTTVNVSGLTASELVATDGSKNLQSLAVATYPSLTELTYVKGVTSVLQTQLNNKQTLDATLTALAGLTVVQGSLIYGTGSDTVTVLAKDANATRYLSNQGTSNNPSWNQIELTNGVTGILPVANGGSGRNTNTAYAVICGGTTTGGVEQSIASVGTAGQVLTSNGASALPTFQTSSGFTQSTSSPSAAADITLTVNFTTYVSYRIIFFNMSSNGNGLVNMVTSSNAGSSYGTTTLIGKNIAATTVTDVNDSIIANLNSNSGSVIIDIIQPATAGTPIFQYNTINPGATTVNRFGMGVTNTTGAIDRVKFTSSSGNFTGTVILIPTGLR